MFDVFLEEQKSGRKRTVLNEKESNTTKRYHLEAWTSFQLSLKTAVTFWLVLIKISLAPSMLIIKIMFVWSLHDSDINILRALHLFNVFLHFRSAMDALHYREMKTFLEGRGYPAHLQRDKGGKANIRRLSRRYRVEQRDGGFYKKSLPVLKEELVGEVQRHHGVLGYDHKCGIRRLEKKIRKDFDCVGLREVEAFMPVAMFCLPADDCWDSVVCRSREDVQSCAGRGGSVNMWPARNDLRGCS